MKEVYDELILTTFICMWAVVLIFVVVFGTIVFSGGIFVKNFEEPSRNFLTPRHETSMLNHGWRE
jgi:hypothetical protein